MKRTLSKLALAFSLAIACCLLLATDRAEAQVPQYYTLRAPAPAMHSGGHGYYPGQSQPVARHGYAYGYFGVQPRRHWSRHTGYYREYTQWSAR